MWKNIGLIKSKNLNCDEFTTERGIKIRRIVHPLMKRIIKSKTGKETILLSYPTLEDGKNYIFAAGHSFPGDIANDLAVVDRSTYTLIGTTDQVDHNPEMYFLWLNGMIYVNKLSKESRKEAYKKMVKVLQNNSSVLLFPEGVLNNTENQNCVPLYPGVYHLSQETNVPVVPIVANYDHNNNAVLIAASDPIDFNGYEKKEALIKLRDEIASLRFNLSRVSLSDARSLNGIVLDPEEFLFLSDNLNIQCKREDLVGDLHQKHMEERKKIYSEVTWHSSECWDEEIMSYHEKGVDNSSEVYSFLDKIDYNEKNGDVIRILAPLLVDREEQKKYDIKLYMKQNWNK
ncbi:MAG: 1-acyl-sn-glycerol-3-phosphate acyltransferase [Bacilli bacterium]|nr:1-acyl-sn-glycerol-3-phosphate acyltransferase [Bacilli bacterium]